MRGHKATRRYVYISIYLARHSFCGVIQPPVARARGLECFGTFVHRLCKLLDKTRVRCVPHHQKGKTGDVPIEGKTSLIRGRNKKRVPKSCSRRKLLRMMQTSLWKMLPGRRGHWANLVVFALAGQARATSTSPRPSTGEPVRTRVSLSLVHDFGAFIIPIFLVWFCTWWVGPTSAMWTHLSCRHHRPRSATDSNATTRPSHPYRARPYEAANPRAHATLWGTLPFAYHVITYTYTCGEISAKKGPIG